MAPRRRTSARDRALEILHAIQPIVKRADAAVVLERSTMSTKSDALRVTMDMVQGRQDYIAYAATGRALAAYYERQLRGISDGNTAAELDALTVELTELLRAHNGPPKR